MAHPCRNSLVAILAALALMVAFPALSEAGLEVSKTVECVVVDGGAEVDLDEIPVGTLIECRFAFEVCAIEGQTVNNIVVTDDISAEFNASEDPDLGSVLVGTHRGNKQRGATPVTWSAGNLDGSVEDACTSVNNVVAVTNTNPSGKQRYTSCGVVNLNAGPRATGTDAGTGSTVVAFGDPVEGRVVNPGDENDSDQDCVPNDVDNCPDDYNPDQTDSDGDQVGDVCDPTPNGE